jgi:hypothetical protein
MAERRDQRHEGTGHEHRYAPDIDDRAVQMHRVVSKRQTNPVQFREEGLGDGPDLEGSYDRRRPSVQQMESPPAGSRWTVFHDDRQERIVHTIGRHSMLREDDPDPAGEPRRGRSDLKAGASEVEEQRGHPPEVVELLSS